MEKILTVVIPSYNVERFLRQTLESFVEESVLEDIEVLVVDDGSKDRTALIGKEFEKQYPGHIPGSSQGKWRPWLYHQPGH